MTSENKDVIRLEAPTDADITGLTPIPVKLKQFAHALDSGKLYYKNSLGAFVLFNPATIYASQAGGNGSTLIGDSGVAGVTPAGGSPGGPGTVHAMLLGLKAYTDTFIGALSLTSLFQAWDVEEPYSQNEIVLFVDSDISYLAISNIEGDDSNTGNDPRDDIEAPGDWTVYGTNPDNQYPLSNILTMILNTKANA